MGAVEQFARRGFQLELADGDNVRAIGTLTDSLRTTIKAQKAQIIDELQWREFEAWLAIVGPAYRTPKHEYAEMRELAKGDIKGALLAYREIVRNIAKNK